MSTRRKLIKYELMKKDYVRVSVVYFPKLKRLKENSKYEAPTHFLWHEISTIVYIMIWW